MITAGLEEVQHGNATDVCDAIAGCGWVAGGLATGGGMAGLGDSPRPIDQLGSVGLGALTGQVQELQDVVDRLAGNAAVIGSFADTWRRVGESIGEVGERFGGIAESGTAAWQGDSGTGYRNRAAEVTGALRETATLSSMVGTLADTMGQVVAGARRTAGDQLADLVQRLISYVRTASAAEGGVTPNVLAQASSMIDAFREPIVGVEEKLRQSMSNVESLLDSGATSAASAGSPGVRLAMNCGPLWQKPMPGEVYTPNPFDDVCGGGGGGPSGALPAKPPATRPEVFKPPQRTLQQRHEKDFLQRERELLKAELEQRRRFEKLFKEQYKRGTSYRAQCEAIYGPPPNDGKKYQAHHPFPAQWYVQFDKFEIETADPKWCAWVDEATHKQMHDEGYNQNWKDWFAGNPNATREDALNHARELANGRYTLPWSDLPWAK
ncbi:WXG100 family type VII secretion target [Lentzea kentuckyensis]|uniref:WXG100 family type VII secretion target n=1 Tax=Lentzea kentuckyensis TaxID=360086 RepID=UPI000A3CC42E|nr:hypothetical protein [Lentzea kentuckyensis]